MLDELDLRGFFGFIATDPVAMVNVLAPKGMVVRASDVVVLNYLVLFVDSISGHRTRSKVSGLDYQRRHILP
jgi:hypothetical protein